MDKMQLQELFKTCTTSGKVIVLTTLIEMLEDMKRSAMLELTPDGKELVAQTLRTSGATHAK